MQQEQKRSYRFCSFFRQPGAGDSRQRLALPWPPLAPRDNPIVRTRLIDREHVVMGMPEHGSHGRRVWRTPHAQTAELTTSSAVMLRRGGGPPGPAGGMWGAEGTPAR